MTWLQRSLLFALHMTLLVGVSSRYANADSLHFKITGTFDTPNGDYPLASPAFEVTFDIPSDPAPADLINFPAAPVALHSTAMYTNNGISTPPLVQTYLLFSDDNNGGVYTSS